jgi:hypothetical protein
MSDRNKCLLAAAISVFLVATGCHKEPDVSADLLKSLHCIITVVEPADLDLYRSLLPDHKDFSMPETPLVGVYVAYFPVAPVEFVESGITLRCKYKGEEGWTMLTNTVVRSERLIYYAAKATGFPKFKADRISMMPSDDGWKGEIIRDGKKWLALSFNPQEISGPLAPWQEQFMRGERYKLDDPLFLLIPPLKGPYAYTFDLSSVAGDNRRIEKGMVRIETEFNEEWTRLVPAGTEVPGMFFMDG